MALAEQKNQPPRPLTEKEIEYVLSAIPDSVASATIESGQKASQQIKHKLRIQLGEIKLCPEKLERFRNEIIKSYHRSIIHPGEPVGITAGEGVAGPITQTTLSGFHQAGSSKNVGSGVDIIRELLNMSQVRRVEFVTIHFKNKNLTFNDVLELRHTLVGITVQSVVKSMEIMVANQPIEQRGWWYPMYITTSGVNVKDATHFLRLSIDKIRLYESRITLSDVCDTLEKSDASGMLFCVPSPSFGMSQNEPTSQAIIDVYVNQQNLISVLLERLDPKQSDISGIDETNAVLFFLQFFVIQELDKFLIKGVPGITQIFPTQPIKLTSLMKSATQIPNSNRWNIWLDAISIRLKGIPLTKFKELFELCGLKIVKIPNDQELTISMSANEKQSIQIEKDPNIPCHFTVESPSQINPIKFISEKIDADDTAEKNQIDELRKQGEILPFIEPTRLQRVGKYVYAETNGTNLKGLLEHEEVDNRRTICNNPNEIFRVIGIEAARNYIIRDFFETIAGSGSYVSPRHVMLLADFMTNSIPMSITSKSVSRQNRGAFSDASFEHAIEAFVKSATFGQLEDVSATSTSIFVGNRCGFGTGIMKLSINKERLEELKKGAVEPLAPQKGELPDAVILANTGAVIEGRDIDDTFEQKQEIQVPKKPKLPIPLPIKRPVVAAPVVPRPPLRDVIMTDLSLPPEILAIVQ